jgi:hypothetical protein
VVDVVVEDVADAGPTMDSRDTEMPSRLVGPGPGSRIVVEVVLDEVLLEVAGEALCTDEQAATESDSATTVTTARPP